MLDGFEPRKRSFRAQRDDSGFDIHRKACYLRRILGTVVDE
jgi:hypothetical protein